VFLLLQLDVAVPVVAAAAAVVDAGLALLMLQLLQ
jgi:hypothetical protein